MKELRISYGVFLRADRKNDDGLMARSVSSGTLFAHPMPIKIAVFEQRNSETCS
jgi:hypothetical protein